MATARTRAPALATPAGSLPRDDTKRPTTTSPEPLHPAGLGGIFGDWPAQRHEAEINPYDIQSIKVLEDPADIAMYGSRGANDGIVITTKKPQRPSQ